MANREPVVGRLVQVGAAPQITAVGPTPADLLLRTSRVAKRRGSQSELDLAVDDQNIRWNEWTKLSNSPAQSNGNFTSPAAGQRWNPQPWAANVSEQFQVHIHSAAGTTRIMVVAALLIILGSQGQPLEEHTQPL